MISPAKNRRGLPLLLVAALAASGCATPRDWDWFVASEDEQGQQLSFAYDRNRLRRIGDSVSGTQMISYEWIPDVTLSRFTIDCSSRSVRISHTRVWRHGWLVSRGGGASSWDDIPSGSVSDALAERVCMVQPPAAQARD